MSALMDLIGSQLGGDFARQVAGQIGADPGQAERAIGAGLPALIGALAKNANASPEGARALDAALERDHDGSALDDLGGLVGGLLGGGGGGGGDGGLGSLIGAASSMLGGGGSGAPAGGKALDGAAILQHIFGGKQQQVAEGVSKAGGIDIGAALKLLATLAPIVMGALGKLKRTTGLDAGGIAQLLGAEQQQLAEASQGAPAGGLLGMLDGDGDGSIVDDVASLAGPAVLGKLFGK